MAKCILFLFTLILSYTSFAQHASLEIPQISNHDQIIHHSAYTLCYVEKYEQASWVAYKLDKTRFISIYKRTNKFLEDPFVTTGSADNEDYKGSGYDRGHLAPAGDMSWSETSMKESFYYSNMSPQLPSFNRGIWKRLEELVRSWAAEDDSLFIVTGPVLTDGLPTIGHDHVKVPGYYYKVILDYKDNEIKAIGFLLPNEGSRQPLQSFAVSIDDIEHITGLNFFPTLNVVKEEKLESTFSLTEWTWSGLKIKRKDRDERGD